MEYNGHTVTEYGYTAKDSSVTCYLVPHERIVEVKMYKDLTPQGLEGLSGIQFMTNIKSCPLFGSETSDAAHISGHQLLAISVTQGVTLIKTITLHFDYDCQISN